MPALQHLTFHGFWRFELCSSSLHSRHLLTEPPPQSWKWLSTLSFSMSFLLGTDYLCFCITAMRLTQAWCLGRHPDSEPLPPLSVESFLDQVFLDAKGLMHISEDINKTCLGHSGCGHKLQPFSEESWSHVSSLLQGVANDCSRRGHRWWLLWERGLACPHVSSPRFPSLSFVHGCASWCLET